MKLKIQTDKGEKEIELKNPKGRHIKKGFKLFTEIAKNTGVERLTSLNNYKDYLENFASELIEMTIEEMDNLEIDEKNKILEFYQNKIQSEVAFLKSSLKLEDSEPKDTPK